MRECLICKSKNTKIYNTEISDFITDRMLDGCNKQTDLVHCLDCGFAFYSYRPNDCEMKKLYANYRNSEYQKLRQKYEEWYTPQINELIGDNLIERNNRSKNLTEIINKYVNISEIKNVLDYAGDKGQHIPKLLSTANKYVYDISGIKPIEGVQKIESINNTIKFDFIMCCHLLEHVSSPQHVIETLREILEENGYLYIELPFDSPFYSNKFNNLQFLFNKYFKISTLIKTFIKQRKQKIMKPMHEHINFYTNQSIVTLLQDFNFEILYSGKRKINCDWCTSTIISILAQKR